MLEYENKEEVVPILHFSCWIFNIFILSKIISEFSKCVWYIRSTFEGQLPLLVNRFNILHWISLFFLVTFASIPSSTHSIRTTLMQKTLHLLMWPTKIFMALNPLLLQLCLRHIFPNLLGLYEPLYFTIFITTFNWHHPTTLKVDGPMHHF